MKKISKTLGLFSLISCSVIATIGFVSINDNNLFIGGKADPTSYSINFTNSKNAAPSTGGYFDALTELGNKVRFNINYTTGDSTYPFKMSSMSSYIFNYDPIYGLKSIKIQFADEGKAFSINYASDSAITYDKGTTKSFTTSSNFEYNFDNANPTYFRIKANIFGINIVSMTLEYTCDSPYKYLNVKSNNTAYGTVTTYENEEYVPGTSVTVKATVKSPLYKFDGWYDNTNSLVSTDLTYTFNMPNYNYSLVGMFSENEALNGVTPYIDYTTNKVVYGVYPRSHVKDASLISALNELTETNGAGYYEYNGKMYAKTEVLKPNNVDYYFDGTSIVNGTTDWFICEPIVWNIIRNNATSLEIATSEIVDTTYYGDEYEGLQSRSDYLNCEPEDVYANNYKFSYLRGWLNTYFYDRAFVNYDAIQTTHVDNSLATTQVSGSTNIYVCDDTYDKVYCLSYADYMDTSIFANKYARIISPTDYSHAHAAAYETTGVSYTRSSAYKDNYVIACDNIGEVHTVNMINSTEIKGGGIGVRPVITISK